MKKHLKKIPRFKTEDQERDFWATHSTTDYIDWSKAEKNVIFPNLKPTSRSISIRLPEYIIDNAKVKANRLNIPYQSLMKQYIARGVFSKEKY